jgi:carbon-nitrogen family hydrolase
MKISLIEAELIRLNKDYNFNLIEDLVKKAGEGNPDVIVLPEIFNTAEIDYQAREYADNNGEYTKELMAKLSKKLHTYIVGGSILEKRDEEIYNTSYVFDRSGNILGSYDKTHLYSSSGEKDIVKAGNDRLIFEIDGIRCGVVICYDIEFASWVTSYALNGVDVLFNPAAWHQDWMINYDSLIRARAIENQIFVVGVNSTGRAYEGYFGGHSQIVDPMGRYIIDPNTKGPIKTKSIDINDTKDYKETFKILKDRREDLYRKLYN